MVVDLEFNYDTVIAALEKYKQKDIDELRKWTQQLDGSKYVPKDLTDKQFLVFYSACYEDLEKAKVCIENYCNHRKNAPELFNHRIMRSEGIKRASQVAEFILLPNKSSEGHDVLFHRIHDTDASNFDLDSVCKLLFMVVDFCLSKRGSQSGLVFIFDMRGISFGHITRINLSTLRTLFLYVQEALPVRMKAIHVLNAEAAMDKIMFLIKPFMDKKFFGMINLHNKNENLESLYKVVSRTNLPSDYDGSLANSQTLHKEFMKELGLLEPYFKAEEEQRMAACPDKTGENTLVNGSWGLPAFVCDVYIAMDVTSSTSSIFNLVAISVDRYIAVTQPIKYAKHKNNRRVWFTIVLVWLISAAIGAPIVLGLNDTPDRNFNECLFNSQNYVIYSSLGSFYVPCIMMTFLYYSIFKALRIRAKKQRAAKKPPVSGDPTTGATTAVVIENVAQTRRLAETALHDDRPTNTGSGSNEDDHDDSFDKRSADLEADADDCHVIPNDKSTEFMLATVTEETANTPKRNFKQPMPDPNGNNDSGYAPSNLEDTIREHVSPPGSPGLKDATVLKNMACDDGKWKKNGKSKPSDSRNVSLQIRSEDDQVTASTFDLRDGSSSKKERKASAATARFTIYKANKASKKKREKSSAKKERKATKTLAIVLGVFLFCWAPFFTCSVLGAICDKIGLSFDPGVTVFILTTWLGYINSFLNPVIYTIFNPEFRKAFRKILHCGT